MAVERNIRFLWDNRWLDAATITPSSAAAGYPATCLQDPFRSRRWRSTSKTGQSLAIDFGETKNFNCVAILDHNLSVDGVIRIKASNTAGRADLLELHVAAWNPLIGFSEDRFGDWGFGGMLLESDRSWYAPNPIRIIYREDMVKYGTGLLFGDGTVYGEVLDPVEQVRVTARHVTIEFYDPDNPDGYIEVSRIFVGQFVDFGINMSNIRHGTIDDSEIARSLGGQAWISKKMPLRRTIGLTFNTLLYGDKYWSLKFMAEKMGITENFIIDCFPESGKPSQRHHSTLYGHFQDLPEIERNYDMGFESDGLQVSATEIWFEEEIA